MKPRQQIALATLLATTLMTADAFAADNDAKNQGYLVDGTDGSIVTSGSGLCWHTSDWTPARAVQQCDPSFIPPPVMAQAAPMPPPAPPMSRQVSFSGDALFAFDKARLTSESTEMLDSLAAQIGQVRYDGILITGHSDRFGSPRYNQELSQRRAQAVKAYLVGKNIPANSMTAEGKGETQPATQPGDCPGAKSAKVIACLQPDRRVEIEVTGTTTGDDRRR